MAGGTWHHRHIATCNCCWGGGGLAPWAYLPNSRASPTAAIRRLIVVICGAARSMASRRSRRRRPPDYAGLTARSR